MRSADDSCRLGHHRILRCLKAPLILRGGRAEEREELMSLSEVRKESQTKKKKTEERRRERSQSKPKAERDVERSIRKEKVKPRKKVFVVILLLPHIDNEMSNP